MPDEKKDEKKQEQPGRGLYDWAQALCAPYWRRW